MRLMGLTILAIFNTIVTVLSLIIMYALFRLNFGLIEGVTDNEGLIFFLFIGTVMMTVLWFALYQLYKYNKRIWLYFYLLIGIVLTVLNLQVFWFLFLMMIYFVGIALIFLDKSVVKEVKEEN